MRRAVPMIAISLLLAAPPAHAEPEEEAIRLGYQAPAGCPSAHDFEARVKTSAPRVRVVERGLRLRLFDVSIAMGESPYGRLTIIKDGEVIGTRDVVAARCDEVASILAFAVALAVDPTATPAPPLPAREPPHEAAPATVVATESPRNPPESHVEATPRAASSTQWGIAVHALGALGLAPNPTLGGGISGEVGSSRWALFPSLRLGLEYATSAPVSNDGARVTFTDALVLIEACSTAWELGRLSLRPCARVEGGLRITASEGIPGAHSVTRPWLDVGATIHLRARVAGPLFVDVGGGPLFTILRDRVYFSPDTPEFTVHEVPAIGARGEIGVGIAFP